MAMSTIRTHLRRLGAVLFLNEMGTDPGLIALLPAVCVYSTLPGIHAALRRQWEVFIVEWQVREAESAGGK
jgi:hypothetical protein